MSGRSVYTYVGNDPLDRVDPSGRDWTDFVPPPLVVIGEAFGGDVAYAVGAFTGNEYLKDAAATGLSENRGAFIEAGVALVTIGKEGESGAGALGRTHTTYTRTQESTGTVYSGRTSGTRTPGQQVSARTSKPDHQAKTDQGYGPAKVDKNSSNSDAIRGREQQLINNAGGAQSQGGTSGNKINGVSDTNASAGQYKAACNKEFGPC